MTKRKRATPPSVREQFEKELQAEATGGVRINKKQNTINMCSQMPNIDLFIKELAANASDAGASRFWVYGLEEADLLTLIAEDNGHGMDREGIQNYFTVFRSRKQADLLESRSVHGTHGVGKLTVAVIPGQKAYRIVTSNGTETWAATTGTLINCEPIKIVKQKEVQPRGTRIEVSFEKTCTLDEYIHRMYTVLKDYTRMLSMEISVHLPPDKEEREGGSICVNDDWKPRYDPATLSELYMHGHQRFDIVMGIGSGSHELYQSRILITKDYNLLSYGLSENWQIGNLWIRVDSPDFRLPFGRHRLINEEILLPLSKHIREVLLPRLIRHIAGHYPNGLEKEFGIRTNEFEQIIFNLLYYDDDWEQPWFDVAVFKTVIGHDVHLNRLLTVRDTSNEILIEDGDFDGVDFDLFENPVLAKEQPDLAMKVIKEYFFDCLHKIGEKDLVFEPKKGEGPPLDEDALRFQDMLGMKDGVYGQGYGVWNFSSHMHSGHYNHLKGLVPSTSVEESMRALRELQRINWRVNYLVDRDGKTPCRSHLFVFRQGEIILNLNHTMVWKLLLLSKEKPGLAGLNATALCLADKRNILPHLSAEVREDLITMDAMLRAGEMGVDEPERTQDEFNDSGPADDDIENSLENLFRRSRRRRWFRGGFDAPF